MLGQTQGFDYFLLNRIKYLLKSNGFVKFFKDYLKKIN